MTTFRVALANLRHPGTPEAAIELAGGAIREAAAARAAVVCFPECYVPGYRLPASYMPPADAAYLERAWDAIGAEAARVRITVVLGTERLEGALPIACVLVFGPDGRRAGFHDKVQIDPTEEPVYAPGGTRQVFRAGDTAFGVVICHEGFRYPETARWAARRGAQVIFHPQFSAAEPGGYRPGSYGEPGNSFHEQVVRCRAAENSCYFATVNYAGAGSPTTSAIAGPDGEVLAWQPYGAEGLLVADLDLTLATGLLARRLRQLD